MRLSDLSNAGALPTLSAMLSVVGQRQRLLVHNIANSDTPDFRPQDIDIPAFQRELARAAAERREATGGGHGELALEGTKEVIPDGRGGLVLRPRTASGNVLYHDRNNRDIERLMQANTENVMTFRLTTDLIRRENELLRTAISQRV